MTYAILEPSDLGRLTCKEQAEDYLARIIDAKKEARDLRQWSRVVRAEDIEQNLRNVIEFSSNADDWNSSEWSFECADNNLNTAEVFLGIEE